ncbi:hypothetical protein Slu03_06980 [Sediminihabitans luteus]|nr:hypothetical protein Slu03_06980 [Sediminihabitans luteus]
MARSVDDDRVVPVEAERAGRVRRGAEHATHLVEKRVVVVDEALDERRGKAVRDGRDPGLPVMEDVEVLPTVLGRDEDDVLADACARAERQVRAMEGQVRERPVPHALEDMTRPGLHGGSDPEVVLPVGDPAGPRHGGEIGIDVDRRPALGERHEVAEPELLRSLVHPGGGLVLVEVCGLVHRLDGALQQVSHGANFRARDVFGPARGAVGAPSRSIGAERSSGARDIAGDHRRTRDPSRDSAKIGDR